MADSGPYGIQGGVVEYAYPGDILTFHVYSSGATTVKGGNLVAICEDFTVEQAANASEKVVGVALHDAAAGETLSVARVGVYYLTAENGIDAGEYVEAGASGKIDAHSSASTGYVLVVGFALEDIAQNEAGRVELRLG